MPKLARTRRIKNTDFTAISNLPARDASLSDGALGLWFRIMTLPEGWDFSIEGMVAITPHGKDAIYSSINELIEKGLCTRTVLREKGRFKSHAYVFHEISVLNAQVAPQREKPDTAKPEMAQPDMENPTQSNIQVIKHTSNQTYKNQEDSVSSESKILPQRLSPFDFVSVLLTNSRLKERSVRQRLGALANKHGDTLTTLLTNIDWGSVSGERIDYLTAAARNEYLKNETWEEYEARNTDTRTLDERLRAEWYEYEARNTDTRTLNERLEAEWYEYEQSRGLTDNQQMQNGNGLETAVAG